LRAADAVNLTKLPPSLLPRKPEKIESVEGERERGPLEKQIYEMLRQKGLGLPEILEADVSGNEPSSEEWLRVLMQVAMHHMEAILRLARELDERAAEDR
jgi:hypothetical protein